MLSHHLSGKDAVATIAVRDMAVAQKFYEDKLGFKKDAKHSGDEVATYKAGNSNLFVYKSKFAGGYGATVVTWVVGDDIEKIVGELHDKNVKFEHYKDMPGVTLKGPIHEADGMKMAWFKDPDGSILALVSG